MTTSPKSNRSRSGFTLIEIMIVLAIIGTVLALGLPAIQRVTYQRINSTTRKYVGLIRTVRNDAVLMNNIYRLVIDFDEHTYYIESQREAKLLGAPDPNASRSKKKNDKKEKDEEPPSNFDFAQKYNKKPVPMPDGVEFDGVLKEREGLVKEGKAYVHFFPNGFNEQAILYLKREGSQVVSYSLWVRPTSGRVDIYQEYVPSFDSVPNK
ncbi:type II secretion system GspH family protein [bacterium]|nr:type II secretion system GspH family protein [bacterium]